MILSHQCILNIVKSNTPLIDPFDEKSLRRSSYDLLIGEEYWISKDSPIDSSINGGNLDTSILALEQSFEIPPHAICYILCKETIYLPLDIVAKVSLRMNLIYKGLMLAAQPPFDPGYKGKVIVMIHNLSNRSIYLKQGDRFVTIEFYKLDSPASIDVAGSKDVTSLQASLKENVITSLQSLNGIINKTVTRVDENIQNFNTLITRLLTIVALIIAFAGLAIAILSKFGYDFIDEKLINLKEIIQKQDQEIASLRSKIDEQRKFPPNTCLSQTETCNDIKYREQNASDFTRDSKK